MRHSRRTIGGYCAAAALLLFAGGCSNSASNSSPASVGASTATVASTSATAEAQDWHPCSISDADIAAAGLDPKTKHPDSNNVVYPGWHACDWYGSWYSLGIYATSSHTFDEVRNNTSQFKNVQPVTIGGREAVQMDDAHDRDGEECIIAFKTSYGAVLFDLFARGSTGKQGDPCQVVSQTATALVHDLPSE